MNSGGHVSPHVAILVHEAHEFPSTGSLLAELAAFWQEAGIRVTVLQGIASHVDADAVILHVNETVTPAAYIRFAEQYPVVINGRATDISKRRVSRDLLRRPGDHVGPVMVKTDRNFGGDAESWLVRRNGGLPRYAHAVRNRFPWSWRSTLEKYPVFASADQVPMAVWYNPDLVVERFMPERRDEFYCVRTWLFFGDQDRVALFYGRDPIVKAHTIIGRERLHDVPADLRQMRRDLGFDFGKFDYAIVEGRTVLYDANRTPSLGAASREECLPWLRTMADGIWSLLPARTA
jgi:hypothetical protein